MGLKRGFVRDRDRRRVWGRPVLAAVFLAFVGVLTVFAGVFTLMLLTGGGTATPESSRTVTAILFGVIFFVIFVGLYAAWSRGHVVVSDEGVRWGWFHSKLIP